MPSVRAVFLFHSSGYNAHTSILRAYRRYTLFECSNVKLYYRQEKARRTHLRAFIVYTAVCRCSIRPRKRCRRAPVAFRRLFIRPSGRGCLCDRSGCPPVRSAASGQQVSRSAGARSTGQVGARPARVVSSPSLLSTPFALLPASLRLFKSRQGESRQRVVSQSRQSRESREVKSRKSRKGRDTNVPTCAKVVKS